MELHIGRVVTLGAALVALGSAATPPSAAAVPAGYPDYDHAMQQLRELAQNERAELFSIGVTATGAGIPVLIVGGDGHDKVPAIAVVGDTGGAHAGVPTVIGMARELLDRLDQPAQAELPAELAYYFIPLPSPDAYSRLFEQPPAERQVNARPADEDFDFLVDEDGFEDLNGDGLITLMRVARDGGSQRTHPADSRVLISADAAKGELGEYDVFSEGVDNDGDGLFNEDPPGGVDFSRNFTFNYPYFQVGAGPHQVSEPETRAVADFLFDHPNIAMVLSFSPEENLAHPWKPGDTKGGQRTGIDGRDEPVFDHMSKLYRELLPEESGVLDAPDPDWGEGSFVEWAYFHYGRWSLAARPWWPAEPPKSEEEKTPDSAEDGSEQRDDSTEPIEDVGNRGKDDLRLLAWNDYASAGRFAPWEAVDHPDFPGKLVEVGGFSPFADALPPAEKLPELASLHTGLLLELAGLLPKLKLELADQEHRGDGVYRLEVKAINLGYLPTVSALGEESDLLYPLQYTLALPDRAQLLDGRLRSRLSPLAGGGGSQTIIWLIDAPDGGEVMITIYSPSVGRAELTLNLNESGVHDE